MSFHSTMGRPVEASNLGISKISLNKTNRPPFPMCLLEGAKGGRTGVLEEIEPR